MASFDIDLTRAWYIPLTPLMQVKSTINISASAARDPTNRRRRPSLFFW